MIGSWRQNPPRPPRPKIPAPDPHIWDGVTVDQNANLAKHSEAMTSMVTGMIDDMPPEQASQYKSYTDAREASGKQAKVE